MTKYVAVDEVMPDLRVIDEASVCQFQAKESDGKRIYTFGLVRSDVERVQ